MRLALFSAAFVCNLLISDGSSESLKTESQPPKKATIFNETSFMVTLSDVPENTECKLQSSKCKEDGKTSVIVTLLNNAESLLRDAKKFASIQTSCLDSTICEKPADCSEVNEKSPTSNSGIFQVWPRSRISTGPINVYCDMEDDGGAWTVIQRRGDFDSGKDYFYQDWEAYKGGFGNLEKDFWLGNDNIFALTNQRSNIVKFSLSDWEGNTTYATYDEFWIDDEARNYAVHFKGYRGTAGDSFTRHNGAPFTTKDRDNDSHDKNCAVQFKGAWWYTACHDSNLNGAYLKGPHESHADGVEWKLFKGHKYSLKDTVIKIRPNHFKKVDADITPQ